MLPVSGSLLIGFMAATFILCIIPGPVVTYLVATGIRQGPRAALTALAGTVSALTTHMILTVAGLAPLLAAMGPWALALKLVGAGYLIWLGVASWFAPITPEHEDTTASRVKAATLFRQGYIISVTNPKTLIFYAAFFPQFVAPDAPVTPQLILLAITFVLISTLSDGAYALAAGHMAPYLKGARAQLIRNRVTGFFLTGAGLGLALLRR